MTPDRYRQINALADAALDLPAGERGAYLDHACAGDAGLREQVEQLVAAHASQNEFLATPLLEVLAKDLAANAPHNDLTGRRIEQYEVLSRLGAGGIGEVWLARDTQLTRQVTLKLLSPAFAGDPEHIRRFRLEARAASLLNHPNIITIYDIGKFEGMDFIAEEFVPGETLRDRLRNGPIGITQVLDIGIQVAAALSAAHAAGIVHRDIKPENIMLRPDGLVKVLDFGLARFVERDPGGDDSLSRSGVVLGTVRYMSPEQARGLPVDAATDVFSLGVVLYEMLAGTPPFSGDTPTDVLAAILHHEPAPLTEVSLGIPAALEAVVHRRLNKDAAARLSSGELGLALREVSAGTAIPRKRRRLDRKWVYAASGIVVLALAALFYLMDRSRFEGGFNSMTITRLATRGESTGAAISPDGKYVAYVLREENGESVWTMQLATGSDVRAVAAEAGEHVGMKFSPDGAYLYYRLNKSDGAHDLYRVPALGGTSVKVMDDVPGSVAFAPDGKHLALVRIDPVRLEASLTVANVDGSDARVIRTRHRPEYYSRNGIAWAPDGKSVACFAGKASGFSEQAFQVVSVRVADGREAPVSAETWAWVDSLAWSADGRLLAVAGSKERADALQIWMLETARKGATRVTNDLSNYRRLTASGDGRLLVALETRRDIDLLVAPAGGPEASARVALESVHGINGMVWAPDGRILFPALSGGRRNIVAVDASGSNQRQISSGPSDKQELAATRDGRYILYSSRGSIWRMDMDGGNPVQLTRGFWDVHPASSADSRSVVYASFRNWSPAVWGKPTLWRVPVGGGQPVEITEAATSVPQVSPDGTKIACDFYPGANPEYSASVVAVFHASGGPPLVVFENTSVRDTSVFWTPDGKSLVYRLKKRGVANLWRQPLAGGPPVPVTSFRNGDLFAYAFSPDFKEVALARGKETSEIVLISGIR